MKKHLLIVAALLLAPLPALAQAGGARTPTAAIDNFHAALAADDAAAAQGLLSPDVLIYEFGVTEQSATAYVAQLLPLDEDLIKTATWSTVDRQVGGEGDMRWVLTKYNVTGTDRTGTSFNQNILETAVMIRNGDLFQIAHLHWSTDDAAYQAIAQADRLAAQAAAAPQ